MTDIYKILRRHIRENSQQYHKQLTANVREFVKYWCLDNSRVEED